MDAAAHADDDFCYLTTTGRISGKPHRIEIWFVVEEGLVFLLAGGRDSADWVRNVRAEADVTFELAGETCAATAWIADHEGVEGIDLVPDARRAMVAKYQPTQPAGSLDRWGVTALPVAVRLSDQSCQEEKR
jgi:deazaflavin-dependent oxidoreductase (nitroreductase family)